MSNIETLSLDVANEHITSRLINKNVFKNVVSVELGGYFYDIQVDLFDLSFKKLKEIHLVADSLQVLFDRGIQ